MVGESVLTEEARLYAIQSLACFETPSVVAAGIKATFGIEITRQSVERYDPYKACGLKDEGLKAIFDTTRETFLAETATIGVSHRAVRLRKLDRLVEMAEQRGAMKLAAELIAQAAKEVGNVYTNRIEASHTHRSHEDALGDLE